ncbi:MAG: phosphomannomutase/phosphoglucomutase [Bdellovibrionales bacterium]|jgi:phosphomannomutase/phosphomannomutase/phosphoglucomutase|nr:phosphomannomutase/phosphoglucomutase [Bdellovibrionales bacterium]
MMNPVIFREYDIRGVVGKDFDEDFAYDLGRAFVTFVGDRTGKKNPTLSLGHDARLSSPGIVKALERGINDSGANVIRLGLVTTPVSYFSCFHLEVDGAFMVTGSHNPPEYNGFKISLGKTTIFGPDIQELRRIIEAGRYQTGKGEARDHDIFPQYVARYKEEFKGLEGVKVVLDCGNGAAGSIARRLYEGVGLKPVILFEEPDGRFPNHHPDPTVEENLDAMKAAVKKEGAAIGIGFDGDADRIGVIDENGRFILGDEMMVIISRAILAENPGAKIIGDVKCSDRLYTDIAKHGGKGIMWKTGHSLVKSKIKEEKAPFGGELSGHIFFADRNYGYDDALYAGLRLVEILAKSKKPLSSMLEGMGSAYNTPEIRIDTTEEKKVSIVEKLRSVFGEGSKEKQVNLIDGIRVSYPDGWALARASNTQPVLVLRFEASTQEGLDRIRKEFESVVNPLL